MGTQEISKMKLIATLAAVASASQFTGVREEDGVQYSAVVTDSAVAYQEGGQSFVAMAMEGQATTEDGLGMHALCYAEGSNLPGHSSVQDCRCPILQLELGRFRLHRQG